jgi:nucleoside-diphosphate-sugar epimerase
VRILVTGNRGYVGSHVVRQLKKDGHWVVGVDLNLFPKSICQVLTEPDVQHYVDFRDINTEVLREIDGIIHLAAISNDPMGNLSKQLTMEINGQGTVTFAKKAKRAGVRTFTFASSCSVYGVGSDEPKKESDPIRPLSAYAESKVYAELGLSSMITKDFNVYLLRNATAYGTSSVFRTDLVLNELISQVFVNQVAIITSDGSPWRPLINCKDMARALVLFSTLDPTTYSGLPINVGFNSDNFRILELGKMIEKTFPECNISMGQSAPKDPRSYRVDFSLLQEIFPGFAPEVDIQSHIIEMLVFLNSIGYSASELKEKRYIRLVELVSNSKFEALQLD